MMNHQEIENKVKVNDIIRYRKENQRIKKRLNISVGILTLMLFITTIFSSLAPNPVYLEQEFTQLEHFYNVCVTCSIFLFISSLCYMFYCLGRYSNVK